MKTDLIWFRFYFEEIYFSLLNFHMRLVLLTRNYVRRDFFYVHH